VTSHPARRLLMLRALGLGDFLTGVPAYRAVRRAFPELATVLAAPPALAELAALTGAIDAILPFSAVSGFDGTPLPWTGPPPAVAVNLHGRGPQSTARLAALRPGRLIAFGSPDGPAWDAGEHEVRRWCSLLDAAGVAADPADLRLAPVPVASPRPGAVVIHPGAASGSRRWPAERFAAVASALRADGHDVVVTGGPAEVPLARGVAEVAGLPAESVLAGTTTVLQLAALVERSALVVCGDTGLGHLATATGARSVLLFGPVSPDAWGPPPGRGHTVLWRGDGSGDPHAEAVDPSLLELSAAEVLQTCRYVLRQAA
jgi:ADP-heptose:LPS heptosyltransferase